MSFDYLLLTRALLPEIALVLGALAVLGYDLIAGRQRPAEERLKASLAIGAIALIAALVDTVLVGTMGSVYGASLMLDTLAVAARGGVDVVEVARAARAGRPWLWAGTDHAARAVRERALAEAFSVRANVVPTSAPPPRFAPATVAAGLAQAPLLVSTGVPALDGAIVAGLGLTAFSSLGRNVRLLGPARRAAGAAGAWEAWRRAPRASGPLHPLLALAAALDGDLPATVRQDVSEALDLAWQAGLARLPLPTDPRARRGVERSLQELVGAVVALAGTLGDDEAVIVRRVRTLREVAGRG